MEVTMNLKQACLIVLCGCVLGPAPVHAGGDAEVLFPGQARYTDAGSWGRDREANLKVLAEHLKGLAWRYLSEGQKLTLEVLDVDLAGSAKPWRASANDLRVLRGKADWPRIELRYVLTTNGQGPRSGKESISDLNYLQRLGAYGVSEPLVYEKRMLDDWFRVRFVEGQPVD
jgi:Protein of unknown function (DUF3016)